MRTTRKGNQLLLPGHKFPPESASLRVVWVGGEAPHGAWGVSLRQPRVFTPKVELRCPGPEKQAEQTRGFPGSKTES